MVRTRVPGFPSIAAALLVSALTLGQAWAAGALPIALQQPSNEFRVHTIDVDQGQAVLVQTLGGKNILIDAGEDYAAPRMIAYLKKLGVEKIDWLMISHRHMDHIGGVYELGKAFPVENVVTPWSKDAVPKTALVWMSDLRKNLSQPLSASNAPAFHTGIKGESFDFGQGAKAEIAWPPKPTGKLRIGDYNEESMVVRVSQAARDGKTASFMTGGDLGWQLERYLAKSAPGALRADGLVGDHHGSLGSFEHKYLEAVAGRPSRLLDALDSRMNNAETRLAHEVIRRSAMHDGKFLADQVGLELYNNQRQRDPLVNKLADYFRTADNGKIPWMTYSAGIGNPYGHPNSERMALAALLGTTCMGTDMQGNIIMLRKLGPDGKWQSDRWEGHTINDRELPLPDVHGRMPAYKRFKDPKNPYDLTARTANYLFSLSHPDPVMPWSEKAAVLPDAGKEANWKFLQLAREARHGRADFVRQFRDQINDPAQQDATMREALKQTKTLWHGLKLQKEPWLQEEDIIAKVRKLEGSRSNSASTNGFVARTSSTPHARIVSTGSTTVTPRSRRAYAPPPSDTATATARAFAPRSTGTARPHTLAARSTTTRAGRPWQGWTVGGAR